jgi:hypothetical protein
MSAVYILLGQSERQDDSHESEVLGVYGSERAAFSAAMGVVAKDDKLYQFDRFKIERTQADSDAQYTYHAALYLWSTLRTGLKMFLAGRG